MTTQVPEDPFAEFEPDEIAQADYVLRGAANGSDLAIAASLGGAFLVYREFMRRRLRKKIDSIDAKDPDDINREALRIFNSFVPAWTAMVGPVLLRGYLNGISETGLVMDSEFLTRLADNYAYSLGVHLNNVSADAMVRGYAAQVNRKVPFKIALANVIDSFGVTNRTAKSLNNIFAGKEDAKLSETIMPSVKKQRAEALIAASIKQRADAVGEQESWNAKQQGKQVVWLYAQRKGIIPDNATRIWETADDELVCPYCGPMHKVEQPISEPFEVPNVGKFWSPPLHPRCRCEVKLKAHIVADLVDEVAFSGFQRRWMDEAEPAVAVAKADDWEPKEHPRSQANGRFVRAGFADPTDIDLDAALRDAEVTTLLSRPAGPSLRPVGPSLKNSGPRLRPVSKPTLRAAGANSEPTMRAKLKTPKLQPKLSPAEMKSSLRNARARMDGKIRAKAGDLRGEVEEEYGPGNAEDMYSIIDETNVSTRRSGQIYIDGSEIVGGKDNLAVKIADIEQQLDHDFIQHMMKDENASLEQHGIHPQGGGEFWLTENALIDVVAWSRASYQTDSLIGEDWVSLPVYQYTHVETGEELKPEDKNRELSENYYDWDLTKVDTKHVRVSTLADVLGVDKYIKRSDPKVIIVNQVRDDDIAYDAHGFPYANPVDTYKISEPTAIEVNGRKYNALRLKPGWLDE